MASFNDTIIEEFRSNNGTVEANGFGRSLVLVHNVGARSGEEYVTPLMGIAEDGGSWLIAASAAGAPTHPAWYSNLLAQPDVTIEVPAEAGVDTVEVTVTDLEGEARDAGWSEFTERSPGFRDYEERAGSRVIPVLRLSRR